MKNKFAILIAIGIFLFCAGCSAPDSPAFVVEALATEMPVETSTAPVGNAPVAEAEAAEELSIVAAEVRYDADATVSVTFTDNSVHTDTIVGAYTAPTTVE